MVQVFLPLSGLDAKKVASMVAMTLVLSLTFSGLLAVTTQSTLANHSQCSDGKDNDQDGRIDYPQDDDCESLDDDYEGVSLTGNFISITDDKESVSPGGNMVYVITLKQQREDHRNVNVSFHAPHQENITSASDGGNVTPGLVRWTNVSVNKNVTRTLTVNVNVSPDASVGQYMVARVLVDGAEATDTTLVANYVAVPQDTYRVSISDGKDYVLPGTNLTYTVRVKNVSTTTKTTDVRASMPYSTEFLSVSDGGVRDNYNVTWKQVTFDPGQERVFTFTALVDRDVPDRSGIRARAYAGTVSALDETVARIGLPYDAVTTSITDNRNTVERGQNLTYSVKVTNTSDVVGTQVYISAGLPIYGQFVSASNGGTTDGNNVRWFIAQLAPKEVRTFTFTIQIRPDAPMDHVLVASAVADGMNAQISRDGTRVASNSNDSDAGTNDVVFRKTADRGEAIPGGSIRYTLYIRNTLDHAITDAVILDRYDSRYLSFVSAEKMQYLMSQTDGRMEWQVPVLQPGETWTTTYVLSVAANAPTGMQLDNVATLRGTDVSSISLTERVRTNTSGVMGDFPDTGAGMDALLGLVLAGAALAATGAHRKIAGLEFLSL